MALIEMAGLPGSGKTTLADALAEALAIPVASRLINEQAPRGLRVPRKFALTVELLIHEPRRFVALLNESRTFDGPIRRRMQLLGAALIGIRLRQRGRMIDAIIDEGLTQVRISVAMDGTRNILSNDLLGDMDGLIVLLKSDIDDVQRRLRARPSFHSSYQQLDESALRAALERGQQSINELQEALIDAEPSLLIVPAGTPQDQVVAMVVAAWRADRPDVA